MPLTTVELRQQWGAAIRARREELGLSRSQLAEEVGIQKESIYRIEKGKYAGSETTQMAIARALRVEVGDLYAYPRVAEEAS